MRKAGKDLSPARGYALVVVQPLLSELIISRNPFFIAGVEAIIGVGGVISILREESCWEELG